MIVTRPLSSTGFGTATCDSGDSVGDLVYISGPKLGSDYQVQRADPSDYAKFPAVAVIVAKLSSTRAVLQFQGEVKGVYTGLIPGKIYWAGASGSPSATPPVAGVGGKMRVQSIGVAVDTDVLRLEPLKNAITRIG